MEGVLIVVFLVCAVIALGLAAKWRRRYKGGPPAWDYATGVPTDWDTEDFD
jgi:hypothetical protein